MKRRSQETAPAAPGVYRVYIPSRFGEPLSQYHGGSLVAYYDGRGTWHEVAVGDVVSALNAPPMPGVRLAYGREVQSQREIAGLYGRRVPSTIGRAQIEDGVHVVHHKFSSQAYNATPVTHSLHCATFVGRFDVVTGNTIEKYVRYLAEDARSVTAVFVDHELAWHYERGYCGAFAHLDRDISKPQSSRGAPSPGC